MRAVLVAITSALFLASVSTASAADADAAVRETWDACSTAGRDLAAVVDALKQVGWTEADRHAPRAAGPFLQLANFVPAEDIVVLRREDTFDSTVLAFDMRAQGSIGCSLYAADAAFEPFTDALVAAAGSQPDSVSDTLPLSYRSTWQQPSASAGVSRLGLDFLPEGSPMSGAEPYTGVHAYLLRAR